MFAEHPEVAWLSYLCDYFPGRLPLLSGILRLADYPVIGDFILKKYGPGEGYTFWEKYCRGFSEPCRDLTAQDVTNKHRREIPNLLAGLLTKRRRRLLIKITGWPRIGFLHGIFEDAKFIHIKREPAAVINSLINVRFWSGWRGPQNWRWGELTSEQRAEWEKFDRSFVALAGIELKILAEAMKKARQTVASCNFMELEYQSFCADPIETFRQVVDFCELSQLPEFEDALNKYTVRSADYKWQEDLTPAQQCIVEYFAADI